MKSSADRIAYAFGYEFSYLLDETGHDVTQKAAESALAAIGLDDEFLAKLADHRYSDEWIGNAVRAKLLTPPDEQSG